MSEDIARQQHERNAHSRINESRATHADAGERAFAGGILGIERYKPDARRPTKGYQFKFGPWKIKVYTTTNPLHLFVKEGSVNADVYVLAGVGSAGVYWCGWASQSDVLAAPVTTPTTKGSYVLPSHEIERGDLKHLGSLCRIIGAHGPDVEQLVSDWCRKVIPEAAAGNASGDSTPSLVQGDLLDTPRDRLQS
ncbi:MAG: hypothetical protein ACR2M1_10440 [Gemmatimonadaceae bacterium]